MCLPRRRRAISLARRPSTWSVASTTYQSRLIVDGVAAAAENLPGKPAPDTFLRAAALLGADPAKSVVVEDASSGVAAGAAGGFAVVVGVDRGGNAEALAAAGASIVVSDLADTLGEGATA